MTTHPLIIAALASVLALASANAQTPEPSPSVAPSAPATQGDAKPTGKEVRAQCRDQAKAQGLKGPERKAAVDDCFSKARPDLAAAQKCRQEGKAKGLADAALKAYVKTCKGSPT